MVSATFERLPENVLPKEYNITIKPNLNTFKFNGQVKIECLVTEATSEISFNVADMEISNYMYVAEIAAENVLMLSKDEKATAKFSSPLPLGKGYLSMDFIGSLNDQMKGLYRSKYVINGEERYAAVSQFEPTDARRAFPCWDEPAIKAVFNITLIVPKDRVALSNMNVKFAPSPIMSTYLVAIVVGEYDYIEDTSEDGVLVRVYTPVVCTLYFKEWWTHLWLNEGFATFMEFLCVDNVPEYNIWTQFVTDILFSVPFSISVKHKNWNDEVNNNHDLCLWMDAHSQSVIQKDSGYVMVSYMRKYCNIVAKKDPCKKTVVLNFSEHVFYTKTITMHCEACSKHWKLGFSELILLHFHSYLKTVKLLTISPVDEISTSKNYYWQDNSKSFCFNSRPSTLCLINTTRNFFTNLLSCSEVHWPNIRSIT
ncbi:Puromycin-sensitive aminopeptidase [Nymphon striatum]|nr:Puromycin-sensitive aminopeptidase [Nymphon striatum]